MQGGSRVDFAAMAVRRGILASALPITVAGFRKLVELCKGLVVLPCLLSRDVWDWPSLGRWVT
jgi:ABC-type antimicrobial peptide transport system permease subunit